MCVVPFFFSASSSSSCFPLAYFLFRLPLLQTRKNTACGKLIRSAATRRPVADTSQSPSTGGVSPPPRGRSVRVCVSPSSLSASTSRLPAVCWSVFIGAGSGNFSRRSRTMSSEQRATPLQRGDVLRGEAGWPMESRAAAAVVCVCVFEAWFRYIPAQH